MTIYLKAALLLVLLGALALFIAIWAFQRYGIYRFPDQDIAPGTLDLEGVRVTEIEGSSSNVIPVWIAEGETDRPVILSFGGMGTLPPDVLLRLRPLHEAGFTIVAMQYRGSGDLAGPPSEAGFAADARDLYDGLDGVLGRQIAPEARYLHGFSLGSGVGGRLAVERRFGAVALEAPPFRSCLDFSRRFRGLPMCWLMWRERYDLALRISDISTPLLIVQGANDRVHTAERARALFDLAPDPKHYVELDAGHLDLPENGLYDTLLSFFETSGNISTTE